MAVCQGLVGVRDAVPGPLSVAAGIPDFCHPGDEVFGADFQDCWIGYAVPEGSRPQAFYRQPRFLTALMRRSHHLATWLNEGPFDCADTGSTGMSFY